MYRDVLNSKDKQHAKSSWLPSSIKEYPKYQQMDCCGDLCDCF